MARRPQGRVRLSMWVPRAIDGWVRAESQRLGLPAADVWRQILSAGHSLLAESAGRQHRDGSNAPAAAPTLAEARKASLAELRATLAVPRETIPEATPVTHLHRRGDVVDDRWVQGRHVQTRRCVEPGCEVTFEG